MLDIQGGQPIPMATPPVQAQAPAVAPVSNIPGVGSPSSHLTLLTAITVLVLVAAAGAYVSFIRADRSATVATRNREIAQLKEQLGTAERVKTGAIADQLKLGVASLQTALAVTSPWTPLLAALADHTPSGVVLTSVMADPKLTLRVNGTAGTYGDVAKLLAGFTASSEFSQVTLDTSAKSETPEGTAIAFAFKATFVAPAPVPLAAGQEGSGQ